MHAIFYSPRAAKSLKKIPKEYRVRIKNKVDEISKNPHLPGTIKLVDYPIAKFRHRAGNYRIFFDIDENNKILEILDIRKRDERTYK